MRNQIFHSRRAVYENFDNLILSNYKESTVVTGTNYQAYILNSNS